MANRRRAKEVPAIVRGYLDCPNCGRIPRPTGTFSVPRNSPSYSFPSCLTCEKCGFEEAILYIEREVISVH